MPAATSHFFTRPLLCYLFSTLAQKTTNGLAKNTICEARQSGLFALPASIDQYFQTGQS
jgi:hypothetical protein